MGAKYCLGRIFKTSAELLDFVASAQKQLAPYSYLEIWLDYLADLNSVADFERFQTFLTDILPYGLSPLYLLRRTDSAGSRLDLAAQRSFLKAIADRDLMVDLDIAVQSDLVEFFSSLSSPETKRKKAPQLILSYHNYQRTPELPVLNELLVKMQNYKPAIFKFACYCNYPQAASDLLSFYSANSERYGGQLIVLGMGDQTALVTRLAAITTRQPILYAPLGENDLLVAGQLSITQHQQIIKILKVK